MRTIQLLDLEDLVRMDDWCRPLVLQTMSGGMSDHYSFASCYSGSPENNVKWARVDQVFGDVWEGKPIRELQKIMPYEFIRGEIPSSHVLQGFKRLLSVKRMQLDMED